MMASGRLSRCCFATIASNPPRICRFGLAVAGHRPPAGAWEGALPARVQGRFVHGPVPKDQLVVLPSFGVRPIPGRSVLQVMLSPETEAPRRGEESDQNAGGERRRFGGNLLSKAKKPLKMLWSLPAY
jgi:hypothetical protein